MRIKILRAGVTGSLGRPFAVGTFHTVGDDYGAALVQNGAAEQVKANIPSKILPLTKGMFTQSLSNRAWGATGTSLHQRTVRIPVANKAVRIRPFWEADPGAAAWATSGHAVACCRLPTETNPKDQAGNDVAWKTASGTTVTGNVAGAAESTVRTYGAWLTIQTFPDALDPRYCNIVIRAANSSAGRARSYNAGNGQINLINTIAPVFSDFMQFAAAGTSLTTNNFVPTSDPDPAEGNRSLRAFGYEIEVLERSYLIASSGDSRTQGDGSTTNLYGSLARSVDALNKLGFLTGYECQARSGSNHTAFFNMAMDRLAQPGTLPDIYYLQGSSSNNTNPWTDATIEQDMDENLAFASRCLDLGVRPVLGTMYPSVSAGTPALASGWRKLNSMIRSSGIPCIDFASLSELSSGGDVPILPTDRGITADTQHLNDVGHQLVSDLAVVPTLKVLMGIT